MKGIFLVSSIDSLIIAVVGTVVIAVAILSRFCHCCYPFVIAACGLSRLVIAISTLSLLLSAIFVINMCKFLSLLLSAIFVIAAVIAAISTFVKAGHLRYQHSLSLLVLLLSALLSLLSLLLSALLSLLPSLLPSVLLSL